MLEGIPEDQQMIECDNQDMMQMNIDALQTESTAATTTDAEADATTDAIDASDQPTSNELNTDDSQINTTEFQAADVTEANSDSSSLPAIAEDLPNGCSQDTKISNELDAEMVSEDELPAPAQPKVDDAEDLSDEELPGPKRAELPADTEVVSEDEFPSSNKIKRKIEEAPESTSNELPNEHSGNVS